MYELFTDDARKVMQLIISRLIEARWLAANDAAVSTLARRINGERRWQELPRWPMPWNPRAAPTAR